MKAVVTGGAGFIGSHVVDALVRRGDDVVVIDDLSSGSQDNLSDAMATGQVELIVGSILDFDFQALFREYRPEVVFHLAAQIDVRKSVQDPRADAALNILATIRLAEAAAQSGVRRVVHTSSGGSIYGEPECLPVSEETPVAPESPYAASKVAGELYLGVFRKLYGLECAFIAPSNVYGPRQNPHGEAGVVAIFSERLLAGGTTKLFGGGTNTRDYVFVRDVAQAFILASGTNGDGMRFNVGTGQETSDIDLHNLVCKEVGVTGSPEYLPPRLGDVARSSLSYKRAKDVLGWTPKVDLSQGIAETVEYFRTKLA